MKAGASKDGPPPPQRNLEEEKAVVSTSILTLLPSDLVVISSSTPNGPHTPKHTLLATTIDFTSTLAADLIYARKFSDVKQWNRSVGVYFGPWMPAGAEAGEAFGEQVRQHFLAIDQVSVHEVYLFF